MVRPTCWWCGERAVRPGALSYFCCKDCEREAVFQYIKESETIWCTNCLAWVKLAIDRCSECGSRSLYPRVSFRGCKTSTIRGIEADDAPEDPVVAYIDGLKKQANGQAK